MTNRDAKCLATEFIIEATDYEVLTLWNEWHCFVPWVQDPSGYWEQIGKYARMPVAVSVQWAIINGHRVAFYEATSCVVDHRIIEKWRDKTFPRTVDPERGWSRRCTPMNFGRCLDLVWPHDTRDPKVMAEHDRRFREGFVEVWKTERGHA